QLDNTRGTFGEGEIPLHALELGDDYRGSTDDRPFGFAYVLVAAEVGHMQADQVLQPTDPCRTAIDARQDRAVRHRRSKALRTRPAPPPRAASDGETFLWPTNRNVGGGRMDSAANESQRRQARTVHDNKRAQVANQIARWPGREKWPPGNLARRER